MSKDNSKKWLVAAGVLAGTFAVFSIVAKKNKEKNERGIDEGNPYLSSSSKKSGNHGNVKESNRQFRSEKGHIDNSYVRLVKPAIDKVLSFGGLLMLSPLYAGISLAIYLDDPGPVLFKQKRVGRDKHFFQVHKFRSMKMSTPHDVPTHQLSDPDQYITRVGRVLRKTSLDELPQIWDIFSGNMSIVGPRPALWNQTDLVEERDKYGANSLTPGLTGWAQINGRDELEIPDKAKLDGEYTKAVHKSSRDAVAMDLKCFFGTIKSVAKEDGVVEGGTGEMNRHAAERSEKQPARSKPGLSIAAEHVNGPVGSNTRLKILICGKGSYIGTRVKELLERYPDLYSVSELDMIGEKWKSLDFSAFDVVYQVAGIAHQKETNANAHLYYDVNRDLALAVAEKAKAAGVKQFIYMSSMSVYGLDHSDEMIGFNSPTHPNTHYGRSKLEAEQKLAELNDESFRLSFLRPPMVYGEGAPGNLERLFKAVRKLHVFPTVKNERSSIHIDNMCEAVKAVIDKQMTGVIIPQDDTYHCTTDIVRRQMKAEGVHVIFTPVFNGIINALKGKKDLVAKAFGNLRYELNGERKGKKRINQPKNVKSKYSIAYFYRSRKELLRAYLSRIKIIKICIK